MNRKLMAGALMIAAALIAGCQSEPASSNGERNYSAAPSAQNGNNGPITGDTDAYNSGARGQNGSDLGTNSNGSTGYNRSGVASPGIGGGGNNGAVNGGTSGSMTSGGMNSTNGSNAAPAGR